jgi:DNA-directed RNA polymerase beta' subunit
MMCHRVKVMPFQTFRLPIPVTPSYNADFDGDKPSCPQQAAAL